MKGSSPSPIARTDGLPLPVNDSPARPRTSAEALMAALSYVSFLGVIPLLLGQKSSYCQWHARQGLTYNIVYFIAGFVAGAFAFFVPDLAALPSLLMVPHAIICVTCVILTLSGRAFTFPLITKLSKEFPF